MTRTRIAGVAVFFGFGIVTHAQSGYDVREARILTGAIVESRNGVADVNACAAACTGKGGCKAFTYIPSRQICELKGAETFQSGQFIGYVSGVAAAAANTAPAGPGFYMIVVGDTQYPRTYPKYEMKEGRVLKGDTIKVENNIASVAECAYDCLEKSDKCTSFVYMSAVKSCQFKTSKDLADGPSMPGFTSGIRTETFNNPVSETLNRNFIASTHRLAQQLGTQNFRGVIINGDLTEFGQDWELAKYKQLYDSKLLPATVYPGLGNHDYHNNVAWEKEKGCPEQSCPNRMVLFLRDEVRKLKTTGFDFTEKIGENQFPAPLRNTYEGSLAYSWEVENVHFVQLNMYPGYQREWAAYVSSVAPDGSAGARTFAFKIKQAYDWLRQDLAKARKEGKAIILNYHDAGDFWTDSDRAIFAKIVAEFSVSAVFVAHTHTRVGRSVITDPRILTESTFKPPLEASTINQFYRYTPPGYAPNRVAQRAYLNLLQASTVPYFYSGTPMHNTYLLVNFTNNNTMTVERVRGDNGQVDRPDKDAPIVVQLKTPKADIPVTLPSEDNYIKFFNQSGYAARYKVTYTSQGDPITKDSGIVLLGAVAKIDVPVGATAVTAKGEAYTGEDILFAIMGGASPVGAVTNAGTAAVNGGPTIWKEIFSGPSGVNMCYKTYGSTSSPQWSKDCQ